MSIDEEEENLKAEDREICRLSGVRDRIEEDREWILDLSKGSGWAIVETGKRKSDTEHTFLRFPLAFSLIPPSS